MSIAVLATSACSNTVSFKDWLGNWRGPEGTSLNISQQGEAYQIIITNLDGPRSFVGTEANGELHFLRDGIDEKIRPGNGQQTGMKWLADKSNCLVVTQGEGYCRD